MSLSFLFVGVGVLMTDSYSSWCHVIVMGVAGNQLFLKTDGNTDQTNAMPFGTAERDKDCNDGQRIIFN